jgi:hypothetical protein
MLFLHRNNRESRELGYDAIELGLFGQGLGLILVMSTIGTAANVAQWIGELSAVLGTALLVAGCGKHAVYQGRSKWWGLMGLLSLVGVIVVLTIGAIPRAHDLTGGFEVRYTEPYRRDVWRMDVRVRLDESVGAGVAEPIQLQVPRGASVSSAIKILAGPIPILKESMLDLKYEINGVAAKAVDELSDGDELLVKKMNH